MSRRRRARRKNRQADVAAVAARAQEAAVSLKKRGGTRDPATGKLRRTPVNALLDYKPLRTVIPPRRRESAPHQMELAPRPRKARLRDVTVQALGVAPSRRKREPLRGVAEAARDALCRDYERDRKARRESMFAKGSAGKGRRNTGPRTPDPRRELCK